MGVKISKNHLERLFGRHLLEDKKEGDAVYYEDILKKLSYQIEEEFKPGPCREYAIKSLGQAGFWILQAIKNEY